MGGFKHHYDGNIGKMSTINIKKIPNLQQTVFVTAPPDSIITETDTDHLFPAGSYGFVVSTKEGKYVSAAKVGKVKDPFMLAGLRGFSFRIENNKEITINGDVQDKEGFNWIPANEVNGVKYPSCFAKVNEGNVIIDQASEGFFCINNQILVVITDLKKRDPLKVQRLPDGRRIIKVKTSEIDTVNHYYFVETDGNMFSFEKNQIIIHPKANLKELFYIKFTDKSSADVLLDDIIPAPVILPLHYEREYNLLDGFCCKTIQLPRLKYDPSNGKSAQIRVDVTRDNGTTFSVTFDILWKTEKELAVYELATRSYHRNEKVAIDFASDSYPRIEFIRDNKGVEYRGNLNIEFDSWYTDLKCKFEGVEDLADINVYRDLIEYKETAGELIRYNSKSILGPYKSDYVYMINDKIYSNNSNSDFHSANIQNGELLIKPKKGVSSFAIYSKSKQEWTKYELRQEIIFDEEYCRNVMVFPKSDINMAEFGLYDSKDSFKYMDGLVELKGKYKLKVEEDAKSGSVITVKTFTAVHESGQKFSFKVTFIYEEYSKTSFILHDVDEFSTPVFRRPSFSEPRRNEPFWTYGQFVGKNGVFIHAYGNEVVNGALSSNIYPIITFNEPTVGYVNTTDSSFPIITEILSADKVINLAQRDEYVRLNGCSNVVYNVNSITVPKNAGYCFFRAGNSIYLLRSPALRSVSFDRRNSLSIRDTPSIDNGIFLASQEFKAFQEPAKEEQPVPPPNIPEIIPIAGSSTTQPQIVPIINQVPLIPEQIKNIIGVSTARTQKQPNAIPRSIPVAGKGKNKVSISQLQASSNPPETAPTITPSAAPIPSRVEHSVATVSLDFHA